MVGFWSQAGLVCLQGDGDEGGGSDQRAAQRPAFLPEGFLLHHAGRHVAASPDGPGGHDGTGTAADTDTAPTSSEARWDPVSFHEAGSVLWKETLKKHSGLV